MPAKTKTQANDARDASDAPDTNVANDAPDAPPASSAAPVEPQASPPHGEAAEPMRYCPGCGALLEPHRCKLRCTRCGYYMSCSDYL